jgi:hypothetical protein
MPHRPSLAIVTVLLAAMVAGADAQDSRSGAADSIERHCRGRSDGHDCGLRFLPQFGAYTGGDLRAEIRTNFRIGIAGGLTYPVGAKGAIGISLWLMAHDGTSASLLAGYRRWIGRGFVLDAEIGTYLGSVLEGEIGNYPLLFPSPIVDVGVSYRDWVGLRARVESLSLQGTAPLDPNDPSREPAPVVWRHRAMLVGARVGRGLGWIGMGVAAVAVAIAVGTCCS